MKHLTLEEILALNPQIDRETLEKAEKIIEASIPQEIKNRNKLVPPFARPRVTVSDGGKTDPRTIVLRQSKR